MTVQEQTFDVCIVCATAEEAQAVLDMATQHWQATFEARSSLRHQYEYRHTTIQNKQGELLTLLVSWLPRNGSQEMGLHLSDVLGEYRPRFVAMTGICTGDSTKVQLGDLVVAERVIPYEAGKRITDEGGRTPHPYDTEADSLDVTIAPFLGPFKDWQPLVARLRGPRGGRQVHCHIAPIASGNAVRSDKPFKEVQAPMRGAVAIDMEAAGFSQVLRNQPDIDWLIVKGVSTYADGHKDDSYRQYAARASAIYALCFIQAYVTGNHPASADQEKEHVFTLLRHVEQEAKECAVQLDLPVQAGYDVLAVIRGQAFLGEREISPPETSLPSSTYSSSPEPGPSTLRDQGDTLTDDILIEHIQSGKRDEAFSMLMERYHGKLAAYVMKHGVDAEMCDEIVQATFEKAFGSLKHRNSGVAHVNAWLFTIARHEILQMRQRERVSIGSSEAETMKKSERTGGINAALRDARLQRGWSQAEVAKAIQVNVKTYSRWESSMQQPSSSSLRMLCNAFGMTAAELGLTDPVLELVNQPAGQICPRCLRLDWGQIFQRDNKWYKPCLLCGFELPIHGEIVKATTQTYSQKASREPKRKKT